LNCSDIERYVYVYLDGEFEERELREFEVHTAQCVLCSQRVAREEQYLLSLQAQWELPRAPDSLRQRIQASIAQEERAATGGWFMGRAGGFEGSLWFSGAFAAALALALFWGELPAGLLGDSNSDASRVTSALGTSLLERAMTDVSSSVVPNRALSLVSNELADNAMETHRIDLPLDVRSERAGLLRLLSTEQLAFKYPPLEESNETRLLGARILRGGLAKSVLFAYDHRGLRVTAVQTVLPKGWERMGGFYSENRRGDHKVVTWRDGRVVTTIVSPDPHFNPMRMRAAQASR
jgi:anti-sigma factor RsiW